MKKQQEKIGNLLSKIADFWQRRKDSNPHKRSQSPVCYLYTTPLNARIIIHSFSDLSTHFLLVFDFFKIRCRLRLIIAHKQVHTRPVAFQSKLLIVALQKALVHGI